MNLHTCAGSLRCLSRSPLLRPARLCSFVNLFSTPASRVHHIAHRNNLYPACRCCTSPPPGPRPAGFKAAGDAAALQSLGARYGLRVAIVDLLMDSCEGLQKREGAAREGAGPRAPGAAEAAGSGAAGAAVGGNGGAPDAAAAPAAAVATCSRVSSSRVGGAAKPEAPLVCCFER